MTAVYYNSTQMTCSIGAILNSLVFFAVIDGEYWDDCLIAVRRCSWSYNRPECNAKLQTTTAVCQVPSASLVRTPSQILQLTQSFDGLAGHTSVEECELSDMKENSQKLTNTRSCNESRDYLKFDRLLSSKSN